MCATDQEKARVEAVYDEALHPRTQDQVVKELNACHGDSGIFIAPVGKCLRRYGERCHVVCQEHCPEAWRCMIPVFVSNMGEQPQTTKLAGLLLGCSPKTVRKLVKLGKIRPLPKLHGRTLLFRFDEIIRYRDTSSDGNGGARERER